MRRFLVGFLATVGLLAVLLAVAAGGSAFWLLKRGGAEALPGQIVLVADLRGTLPEARSLSGLAELASLGDTLTVSDVVFALDQAAADPRVKGLVAQVDGTSHGFGAAQELREAVQRFRASGRFAIAQADSFGELSSGNEGYYLATAFERIDLQPVGLVGLTGLAAQVPSGRDALAKLGVELEVGKRAEYKTALEPFSEPDITPANREMLDGLLDDLSGQLAEGIAAGRKLPPERVRQLIDGGPYTGPEARDAGLIDQIGHLDVTLDSALGQAGPGTRQVSLEDYAHDLDDPASPAATIALIRATGLIRGGEGATGSFAADEIITALRDARNDAEVKAILLRVDSGGGSAVASETIAHEVARAIEAGKPVVVSFGNTGASGAYWVAMGATGIVAQPATLTGSIGVVAGKPVLQGLWEKLGVRWAEIPRGANSTFWSFNERYSPAERARLEAVLDDIYGSFKAGVAQGRKLDAAAVENLARGRVWSGRQALDLHLVDRLGGLPEALALVKEKLGLAADASVALEPFPAPKSPLRQAVELLKRDAGGLGSLAGWVEEMAAGPGVLQAPVVRVR